MNTIIKTGIWQQFGASIDMLNYAMQACPDELWTVSLWKDPDGEQVYSQFWYRIYHTLFWLDLYLSGAPYEAFTPPAPFKRGVLPEKPYTKEQLRLYLEHGRRKCRATIDALTEEQAGQRCKYDWGEVTFFELLLYNMRHVQAEGGQLNVFLGQQEIAVNDWVTIAED